MERQASLDAKGAEGEREDMVLDGTRNGSERREWVKERLEINLQES